MCPVGATADQRWNLGLLGEKQCKDRPPQRQQEGLIQRKMYQGHWMLREEINGGRAPFPLGKAEAMGAGC